MERYTIYTHTGAEDSSGKAFGIEAKHFLPILYALIVSLIIFFVLSMIPVAKDIPMLLKIAIGFAPLVLSMLYIAFLVAGKPPHYQEDFWEALLRGSDFNVKPRYPHKNPLNGKHNS